MLIITALVLTMQVCASSNDNFQQLEALKAQVEAQTKALEQLQASHDRQCREDEYRREWVDRNMYEVMGLDQEAYVRMKINDEKGCIIL